MTVTSIPPVGKYETWYKAICARGNDRYLRKVPKKGYEDHHIQPVSLGGKDTPANFARLTPREHFVAHWLFYKMNRTCAKAQAAFWFMANASAGKKINSKSYSILAAENVKRASEYKATPETCKKLSLLRNTPEAKARDSKMFTELRKKPHMIAAHAKAMREMSPEKKQHRMAKAREALEDPVKEAARVEKIRNTRQRPDLIDSSRQQAAKINSSPELRAKQLAAVSRPVQRSDGVVFKSISEAARHMGGKGACNIGAVLAGRQATAYGYRWAYVDTPAPL
jgi:hypothetical protein